MPSSCNRIRFPIFSSIATEINAAYIKRERKGRVIDGALTVVYAIAPYEWIANNKSPHIFALPCFALTCHCFALPCFQIRLFCLYLRIFDCSSLARLVIHPFIYPTSPENGVERNKKIPDTSIFSPSHSWTDAMNEPAYLHFTISSNVSSRNLERGIARQANRQVKRSCKMMKAEQQTWLSIERSSP